MLGSEIRVAIAEACGWMCIGGCFSPDYPGWINPRDPWGSGMRRLPDYPNDLNAMHEAEKILGDAIYNGSWLAWLRIVVERSEGLSCNLSYYHCATAIQRAEAFLRTIGKYKNS